MNQADLPEVSGCPGCTSVCAVNDCAVCAGRQLCRKCERRGLTLRNGKVEGREEN